MIEFIANLVSSSLLYNLAMTILHSLWQGAILVFLMNLYLKYSENDSPTFRYNIAFSTLMLIGVAAIGTFIYYSFNIDFGKSSATAFNPIIQSNPLETIPTSAGPLSMENFDIKTAIPLISGLWIVGVVFFTTRLLLGYVHIIEIKRSLKLNVPIWLTDKLESLKQEYGISQNISVAISHRIISPLMMGVIRPTIVFPVAAINQLSPEEIELILRHEIGHIIRRDYVQNFVVRTMQIIMFYHPCVWWTTRIIEKERENHCDDYAISGLEDKIFYAKTLVKIREMRASQDYQLALGFSKNNQSLLNRIKRILNHNQKMSIMKGNLLVGIVLLSSLICLSAGTFYFKNIKADFPEKIETKRIESLDINIPKFPLKLRSEAQDTSKEELRKMIREREEKIREKSREMREKSRELRESTRELRNELRELRRQNGDRSYRFNYSGDWDEKDWEEFSEKMEKWGEEFSERFESEEFKEKMKDFEKRMEEWGKDFEAKFESEEFKEKMKKFEKRMEEWGKEFEAKFDSEEFKEKMKKFEKSMEEWGEDFGNRFEDEEFQLHIEELAEASSELGLGVASSVMAAIGDGFEFDFDAEHFNNDFEYSFGEMGEEIGEMVSHIVEEVTESVEGLDEFDGDFIYVNADRSELSNLLLSELKSDGFYKKNEVSLTLDSNGVKINGKKPSSSISDKYLDLIQEYHDIELGSGHKLTFKYSDKKGNKKNSLSIEKSN